MNTYASTTDIVKRLRDGAADLRLMWLRRQVYAEAADEIERLRAIEQAATHLTASAGFRPGLESPFGTEVVVVLRDRFEALGEALS